METESTHRADRLKRWMLATWVFFAAYCLAFILLGIFVLDPHYGERWSMLVLQVMGIVWASLPVIGAALTVSYFVTNRTATTEETNARLSRLEEAVERASTTAR